MYSETFIRFLIGRDADDFIVEEKEKSSKKEKPLDNKIYRGAKYVTVPIEIKHH